MQKDWASFKEIGYASTDILMGCPWQVGSIRGVGRGGQSRVGQRGGISVEVVRVGSPPAPGMEGEGLVLASGEGGGLGGGFNGTALVSLR